MVSGFSFPFQGLIANHLYIDGNVSDSGRVFFFFGVCVGGGGGRGGIKPVTKGRGLGATGL